MLFLIDRHSGVPVFRQLRDQVRFQIASGQLKAGDEMPSTRALSADLGINPMTVSKVYGLLEKEGMLLRRPGRPLVVQSLVGPDLAQSREEQLTEALASAVAVARQLEIEPARAGEILAQLLKELPGPPAPPASDPQEGEPNR